MIPLLNFSFNALLIFVQSRIFNLYFLQMKELKGCNARVLSRMQMLFLPIEFARDVIVQSETYSTTQATSLIRAGNLVRRKEMEYYELVAYY